MPDTQQNPPQPVTETEADLVNRAQSAVSQCNWVVGECAADWTERYARGRTDQDFGRLVGLSGDQVFQRRRVWETFADVRDQYHQLKWSHFYVAINWNDAPECLQWAEENSATVAEMKAWRRAMNGEDLDEPAPLTDDWGTPSVVTQLPTEMRAVVDPDSFGGGSSSESSYSGEPGEGESARTPGEAAERVPSFARDTEPGTGEYAPFRADAGTVPPSEAQSGGTAVAEPAAPPDVEQLLKRAASQIERIGKALSPAVLESLDSAPSKVRQRFVRAVSELAEKAASIAE